MDVTGISKERQTGHIGCRRTVGRRAAIGPIVDDPQTAARRTYRWGDLGLSYRSLAAILTPVMPVSISTLLLFTKTLTYMDFTLMLCSSLAETFCLLWFVRSRSFQKRNIVYAFLVGGILAFLLAHGFLYLWRFLYMAVVLSIVLYRMLKLINSDSIVLSHRSVLLSDMVLVFLSVILLELVSLSFHGTSSDAKQIILFCGVSVVAGRIYLSWKLERLDSMASHRLPLVAGVCALCLCLGILMLFVPAIFTVFQGVLAGSALVFFTIVYKPLDWFITSLRNRHHTLSFSPPHGPVPPASQNIQTSHKPWVSGALGQHIIQGIGILVFLVGISILLTWIHRSWRKGTSVLHRESEVTTVVRTFIRKKRLGFEQTDDAERIRYQKWLFAQHGKGYTILDDETPREFLKRLSYGEEPQAERIQNTKVTKRYEQSQFGVKK